MLYCDFRTHKTQSELVPRAGYHCVLRRSAAAVPAAKLVAQSDETEKKNEKEEKGTYQIMQKRK
jgi:hypothetical protein